MCARLIAETKAIKYNDYAIRDCEGIEIREIRRKSLSQPQQLLLMMGEMENSLEML